MKIECAKSSKPLGVRGQGEGGIVFCPDPMVKIRKGSRKKYSDISVTFSVCQNCEHYRGVHKTMNYDLMYTTPFGDEERMGEKRIVLRAEDAEKHKEKEEEWCKEEIKRGIEKQ